MCCQLSVENVTTFYVFRGLRVRSRGLDSKCQFQDEIIYNLFKVAYVGANPHEYGLFMSERNPL